MSTSFVTMLLEREVTVVLDIVKRGPLMNDFFSFFFRRTDPQFLADFLRTVFIRPAQHILASRDRELSKLTFLPRVSKTIPEWDCYVDILFNAVTSQYGSHVGSATGLYRLWSRLQTYYKDANYYPTPHQAQICKPNWHPSIYQLADCGLLPDHHRCYTVVAEALGIVLTDSYDPDTSTSAYASPQRAAFVRDFQVMWDIPIRTDTLKMNHALPIKQHFQDDKRFCIVKCSKCDSRNGPFTAADPVQLYIFGNAICEACCPKDRKFEDHYNMWQMFHTEKCMCCNTSFGEHNEGRKKYLADLELLVCCSCQRNWEKLGFFLPIQDVHIPPDHVWCCDDCGRIESRWFGFEHTGKHAGHYHCFGCRMKAGLQGFPNKTSKDRFYEKHKNAAVKSASYPAKDMLRIPGLEGTNHNLGFRLWAKNMFGIDLLSREACLEQRKKDLAVDTSSHDVLKPFPTTSSAVPSRPVKIFAKQKQHMVSSTIRNYMNVKDSQPATNNVADSSNGEEDNTSMQHITPSSMTNATSKDNPPATKRAIAIDSDRDGKKPRMLMVPSSIMDYMSTKDNSPAISSTAVDIDGEDDLKPVWKKAAFSTKKGASAATTVKKKRKVSYTIKKTSSSTIRPSTTSQSALNGWLLSRGSA